MKYFVIIILAAFGLLNAVNSSHAQSVTATTGGNYTSAEHYISWTIGEALISTVGNTTNTLTQGMHQPTLSVTGIFRAENTEQVFAVYPNPVEHKLSVDIGNYESDFKLQIINNTGAVMLDESFSSEYQKYTVNVQSYLQGVYFLHVLNSSNAVLQSFKIVKL